MAKILKYIKSSSPVLFIIWLVLIIIFSSLPSLPDTSIDTNKGELDLDFIFHFGEYLGLAFISVITFAPIEKDRRSWRLVILALALIAFAILDESHQLLIQGRSFNYSDMLCNIAGVSSGIVISPWIDSYYSRR